MKIRHIVIEHFRGINSLDWYPQNEVICLIGAGDSRKSTIIDAIDLVLSPRSYVSFDDSDFFQLVTDKPLTITVSVTGIPPELTKDSKFGLRLCGYNKGACHDEFSDGDEPMLTIRLTVDKSLEPEWSVINKQNPDGYLISGRDREKLGIIRLGGYVNQHLTWRRGTALSRLTGQPDDIDSILAEATRMARKNITTSNLANFRETAKRVEELGKALGVLPQSSYVPNLDAGAISIGESGFTLHDGEVPIRRVGLGARRLLIMAVQCQLAMNGSIVLVDEFEHGLEPHRVRHLLRSFVKQANANSFGQVILTSHSPEVIEELPSRLNIVRSGDTVVVSQIPENLVSTIRKAPEAILGRRIIVCEGKTEVGFCRACDDYLIGTGNESFACRGIIPIDGNGTEAIKISGDLVGLGYQVLYLGDSDTPEILTKKTEMEKLGIVVQIWKDNLAIEQRVFNDIPWIGVIKLLDIVANERGEEVIRDNLASKLAVKPLELGNYKLWNDALPLRKAIGETAKKNSWFKRIDSGEAFGKTTLQYLGNMLTNDIEEKINVVKAWCKN
jgi:putative ATP-dependent endonuclease of the OLD family